MKDINIKGKYIKRELTILGICFAVAMGLNIYAVIYYKTHWSELFSQMHYVVMITGFLYALILLLRLVFFLVKSVFTRITSR